MIVVENHGAVSESSPVYAEVKIRKGRRIDPVIAAKKKQFGFDPCFVELRTDSV